MLLTEKLNPESTLCAEFRFMVEQLQMKLQQDIKTTQQMFQKDQEHLSTKVNRGNTKMDELHKKITEIQLKRNINFKAYGRISADIERESASTSTTPHTIPAPPIFGDAIRTKSGWDSTAQPGLDINLFCSLATVASGFPKLLAV